MKANNQAGVHPDFPRPASLPAGENAKPIVWEDAEAPEALTFRLAGNSGASWSHAVYPDELGEAFLTFEDKGVTLMHTRDSLAKELLHLIDNAIL